MTPSIADSELIRLAEQQGTPLYVYHAEKISDQYQQLVHSFSGVDARFFYAAKALTNIHVLAYIKSLGCNVDCSSINEVQLALRAGFDPRQILYTSNNIPFEEIEQARNLGVHINIDSLSNLRKFGHRYGNTYPVGVRLKPNILAGGHLKIATGHASSKFGVPIEQLSSIQEIVQETGLPIHALHIHTGSEIQDVEVFIQGVDLLLSIVPQFPQLQVLDLGGGFKVPYKPGETGTDMVTLGRSLSDKFNRYRQQTGTQLQAWFEPGKFLVSEAGHFITRVTVLKDNGAIVFAGINSGLNHLIRPMFYDAYHRIDNISNPAGVPKKYHVVGYICETDTFAEDRPISEIREGDYLVIRNAGAYGYEMASNYNSRFRPAEVLYQNGAGTLIRRRETMEDLLRSQLELG